jgi:hypothetical protein
MILYTEDNLIAAYVAGKTGKPLPKPEGVDLVQVNKLNGHEYTNLYFMREDEE